MSAEEFEAEGLLSGGSRSSLCLEDESLRLEKNPADSRGRSLWRLWRPAMLHTSIILIYTIAFLFVLKKNSRSEDSVVFSPYERQYQPRVFEHGHSVYVGAPSDELDKAWEAILYNMNIRVTEWEMSKIPGRKDQAISLPDGGYFASMNVYHNLHCIKRLHHYMYSDMYFPNITQKQKNANEYHNHHCLDMLRQSIMCQGDTQLLTMKWRSYDRVPTANFTMPHKCVNWENLDKWAATRRITDLMEPGYLMHPTLGPAYIDGHGDLIGESGSE